MSRIMVHCNVTSGEMGCETNLSNSSSLKMVVRGLGEMTPALNLLLASLSPVALLVADVSEFILDSERVRDRWSRIVLVPDDRFVKLVPIAPDDNSLSFSTSLTDGPGDSWRGTARVPAVLARAILEAVLCRLPSLTFSEEIVSSDKVNIALESSKTSVEPCRATRALFTGIRTKMSINYRKVYEKCFSSVVLNRLK